MKKKLLYIGLSTFAIIAIGTICLNFRYIQQIFAAGTPWTQTDWSGGTASGTVSGTVTTYESSSNIDTSTAGQISLSLPAGWSSSYTSWQYRAPITITNGGSSLSDHQVVLSIDTSTIIAAGKMESDCLDIRLSDSSGNALPYWVETGKHACDTTQTYIWTKLSSIPSGDTTVYLYYGNSGASDAQDGSSVFEFFDDFSDSSIDGSKWSQGTISATTGTAFTESSGNLVGGNTNRYIQSSSTFTGDYIAEARVYEQTSANNGYTSVGFWASTSNSWGTLVHNGTTYLRNNSSWPNYGSFSRQKWSRDKVQVIGTSGYAERVSEDETESRSTSATNSGGISSEYLRLSSRYDSSATNQNYVGYWDWIFVRKGVSTQPTSGSLGSEEPIYSSSGTLTSNIFDAVTGQDWEALEYTTSGTGTVVVKVRTSNNSDMSGATAFSSCSAIAASATMSTNACVTDSTRYVQYQITLSASGANSPVLEYIELNRSDSDNVTPTTNASSVLMSKSNGGDSVSSNGWNNSATPYFSWTAGADNVGGSGLKGYCLYLGTDSDADPATAKGSLGTSPLSLTGSTCQFIVSSTSVDLSTSGYIGSALVSGSTYYLSIKAIDFSNNIYSGSSAQFQFRHDVTRPTNVTAICPPGGTFSNVADMSFSWTTSSCASAASDSDSGLLGYQYQLNSTDGSWVGTSTDATCGIDYIPYNTYTRSLDSSDEANINIGANIIYFRTVDIACNTSSDATIRTGSINYGGAAPTFGGSDRVTISPTTSTTNSFAFSWPAATPSDGRTISKYYYMINTSPPSLLSTITSNTSTYISNGTSTSVSASNVAGVVKGSNTIYVVAVDDQDNYSPSSVITGTFTLNSTNPDPPTNLSASDASVKSASLWRASLAWGVPSYKGTNSITYKVQRSTNGSSWTDVATTSGTAYVDTVSTSDQYYWRVCSYDTSSESIASPSCATGVTLTPKGSYTEPPALSSDPTVTSITTRKATISWSTDRVSDSKVQYGTGSGDYYDEEPSNSDQVTSHTISLTNLTPGTTYYFRTKWTDEDGNTGISEEDSFTTEPRPVVKEALAKNISLTSATLQFISEGASKIKVYYGKTSSFGSVKESSTSTSENLNLVSLEDLEDGTKYFYKINTFDIEDGEYEGDTNSFETLPRPQVSAVRIQQVANTAESSVFVSWQSNTEISSIITYYPENNPSQARDEVNIALQRGEHKMVVRGLIPQTTYIMIVKGTDKAGNQATSDTQRFTTATDTRPPQISDLSTEGSTQILDATSQESVAQIVVSWNTDEPATSQVEFGEGAGTTYSQKTQEDSNATLNHLVVISGLTPSKVYHLRAISKDLNGNISESVDTVTITPKATDNALDLVISNLQEAFGFIGDLR